MPDRSQIQQVKDATDIVEIIGAKVELKRVGSYWRGLSPWTNEKTPSFFVSEKFQRFKDYSSGKSGDVFTFLEEHDGLTFHEAVTQLADLAGITLQSYQPSPADHHKEQVLAVLDLAKNYYHYLLTKHQAGQMGREYAQQRGITNQSIRLFELGVSLDSWNGLTKYLHRKKKYSLEVIESAGLSLTKNGRTYDRFRNRLMFPLKNHRGQVVGFSGRVLDTTTKAAKYINSPETTVYKKSELLFGFHELYQAISKKNTVILTEGELDVISSAQVHVNHIVAIKGSAISQHQAKLLKRAAEVVILSLDSDSAGVAATKRAIPILEAEGLELRVLQLPSNHDPDDLARTNPNAWRQLVKQSVSVYDYLLQIAFNQHDATTASGKRNIVKEVGPLITAIAHAVERDVYVRKLASQLQVRLSVLEEDLRKLQAKPVRTSQLTTNEQSAATQQLADISQHLKHLWFWILNCDKSSLDQHHQLFSQLKFEHPHLHYLHQQLLSRPIDLDPKKLVSQAGEDVQELLFELAYDPKLTPQLDKLDLDQQLVTCLTAAYTQQLRIDILTLTQQLETSKNDVSSTQLLEQIKHVQAKLKAVS